MIDKPWYLPPSALHVEDAPHLCEVCTHINFQWLLENDFNNARYTYWKSTPAADDDLAPKPIKIPWVSEWREYIFPELSLGFLFEILEKSKRCSFCRLVCLAIAAAYRTETDSLLSQTFGDFPSQFVFCRLVNKKKDVMHREPEKGKDDNDGQPYDLVIDLTNIEPQFRSFKQVSLHRICDEPIPHEGRLVTPRIDFTLAKNWMARFESSERSPASSHGIIPGFRVIDVVNKNVVPVDGPGGCRYLILSYVWGGPQEFQNVRATEEKLRQEGSLSQHPLPRTIEDAIAFTVGVGERYLWVDSLCIVQDDGDAKMVQIHAMDKIYRCALSTIVASDGTSCHDGLPGVQETPARWQQHTADVRGIKFANKQFTHADKERTWPTRGWTYQEHALSQRCIHFSQDGLEFESEDGLVKEDIHPPPHVPQPARTQIGFPMGAALPDIALFSNIEIYALSIMFYSFRNLTFDTDALNAFQGVLNVHRDRFRRDFIFGLPSSELEFSFLWQPGSAITKRAVEGTIGNLFPTWSWVAWKGSVMLPILGTPRFSRVTWFDAGDMTTEFTSDQWRGTDSADLGKWEIVPDRGDNAPWYYEDEDPTARFAHPVSKDIPPGMRDRSFLKPGSHQLTFSALATVIKCEPGSRSLQDGMSDPNDVAPAGVRSYTLQDRFNEFCGVVYLHSRDPEFDPSSLRCVAISRTSSGVRNSSPEEPPPDDCDVVAIRDEYAERQQMRRDSEGRSASNYYAVYDFELKWKAYDVLVVGPGNDGSWERIGVGMCLVEAFWDAGPKRERIELI